MTHGAGPFEAERAMAQPTLSKLPQLLLSCCIFLCPEFALPLSIWLCNGWSGLLLHWRADLCAVCQMERTSEVQA